MAHLPPAVHRTILVVDVEGFGDQRRTNPHQVAVRSGVYRALEQSFHNVDIPWEDCHHEDRGDGVFILAPPEVPKGMFVDILPSELVRALCEHNATHCAEEQIRLRMSLHAGEINYDEHGVTSAAINLAFRLLDARPLKDALAHSRGVLALIASSWFFDEVVRHIPGVDLDNYLPVRVAVKETTTVGWICLPDHPYPPRTPRFPTAELTTPVPRQLPSHSPHFVGRAEELRQLTALLDTAALGRTVVISAIRGVGGIGKTWLAVHWAHQNMDRFPDGQLHVNLRGFDPAGAPVLPTVAVRGFLEGLGVDPGSIPAELDAQVGMYRSLVADRRMLIVLDNARDSAQIAPLLPGGPNCTVLITSRHQLGGLAATHGALLVPLDVLPDAEARELLARHLGHARVGAEPAAVAEILNYCAGLPLAISIVAARAIIHADFPLAVLAEELRDASARLDALNAGELSASMRAVISWSYDALNAEPARVFRMLGLVPGPDISLSAAASLTALTTKQSRELLQELECAHLVTQNAPDRYRLHDLLRLYAAERADCDESQDARHAALRRLVDFYLHTVAAGDRLLYPHREPIELGPPADGCLPHPLDDEQSALAWFDAEHPCLLAAQRLAAERGWHTPVWQLAWTLDTFHRRRGRLHDQLASWRAGLVAAEHLGKWATQALAYRRLGRACARLDRPAEALKHLRQALTLAEQVEDVPNQAHTHYALAQAWEQQGDDRRSITHATQALYLFQGMNNPIWEAQALNLVGWFQARLGHSQQALACCESALTLFRQHHDRDGEANTLDSLGYIAHHTGRFTEALGHYQQALALYRDLGDTYFEADTLARLGRTYAAGQQHAAARAAWRQALTLYQVQHRTSDADRVQQQLDAINDDLDRPLIQRTSASSRRENAHGDGELA